MHNACLHNQKFPTLSAGRLNVIPTNPAPGGLLICGIICYSHAKTKKPPLFITRNSNKKDIKCKYRYRPLTIFVLRVIQFGIYSTTAITKDTLRIPYLRQIYSNTPHC